MSENASSLRVLLVEDDPSDAYLVQSRLEALCAGEFTFQHVTSVEEALPCLAPKHTDVILLDLNLAGASELDALARLQYAAPDLPVVILTGRADETLARTALQHGAQDYLVKEQAGGPGLRRALHYALERKRCEENLSVLANYDALTGLANRNLFVSRMDMALIRARRTKDSLAVFFIDLDEFKQVNDRQGHEAGDELLRQVGERLKSCLRECDTIARFGGDEFAVLLENTHEARDCAVVAEKMIRLLSQPFMLGGNLAMVGASIGIAISTPAITSAELMGHADKAMYRAKKILGSNYKFYTSSMLLQAQTRLQMERDFQDALAFKSGLELHYQPKLDTASDSLVGAEALLRWKHPTLGMLTPPQFLPMVQETQMTDAIDRWVLETIRNDIRRWKERGTQPLRISVHLLNGRCKDARGMERLLDLLSTVEAEKDWFAIELEEAPLLQLNGAAGEVMSRLRSLGLEIHLDNFGADTASLTLLTQNPPDAIKIDRKLTAQAASGEDCVKLLSILVDLGHRLGMTVVAEGVETQKQRAALSRLRCDQVQGHAIARPLPEVEFSHWMTNHRISA